MSASLKEAWLHPVGHTWPVSVARILMALVAWSEIAPTYRLFAATDGAKLWLALLFWVASPLMLLGVRSRWSTLATGLSILGGWVFLGELGTDDHFRRHHVYMLGVSTICLAFTPCGGALSWDRLQGRGGDRGDLWALSLLRLQVVALYLYGAWDKTYWAFPERMESYYLHLFHGAEYPGEGFAMAMVVAGYGAVLLEYVLAVGFLSRRATPWMVLLGIGFHFLIYWTLTVSTFTVLMYVLFIVLLDPDWLGIRLQRAAGVAPTGPTNRD